MDRPVTELGELETWVGHARERWSDVEGAPECSLVRLFLLRQVVHLLHSQKSRQLALGNREAALSIKQWEARAEWLRDHRILEGDLLELLRAGPDPGAQASRRKALVPEALLSQIGREKLERYDRQWEASIASEAATLGWGFYRLEAAVLASEIASWDRRLSERLWPHGEILFSEAGSSASPDPTVWLGRWYLILNPKFRSPEELSLGLEGWPEVPKAESGRRAQFKLLFAPRPNR